MTVMDAAMRPVVDAIEVPTELLVAGAWRPAASGRRLDVSNPATDAVLASVADADPGDAVAAVDAAAAAAADWASTAPRFRADLLMRAFDLMHLRSEDLARLICLENGKSLPDARSEVGYAAEFFRWYAEEGVRLRGQVGLSPSGANRLLVTHQPVGVSVLITPWNFPAAMATRKIAAAQVLKCGMELGGNAPFVVLGDADVDAALDGAMVAKMRNGGQACTAANRFFVQVGPGIDESSQCGPLISDEAVAKVEVLVRDALDRGARAVLGGRRVDGPGCFYPPTVLVDVPRDARVLHE